MSRPPPAPVDDGYRTPRDIARGCEFLADAIANFQAMLLVAINPDTPLKQRTDAIHYLTVHGPAMLPESRRLARAAVAVLHDGEVSPP
mgnify:CR=1 FL=1